MAGTNLFDWENFLGSRNQKDQKTRASTASPVVGSIAQLAVLSSTIYQKINGSHIISRAWQQQPGGGRGLAGGWPPTGGHVTRPQTNERPQRSCSVDASDRQLLPLAPFFSSKLAPHPQWPYGHSAATARNRLDWRLDAGRKLKFRRKFTLNATGSDCSISLRGSADSLNTRVSWIPKQRERDGGKTRLRPDCGAGLIRRIAFHPQSRSGANDLCCTLRRWLETSAKHSLTLCIVCADDGWLLSGTRIAGMLQISLADNVDSLLLWHSCLLSSSSAVQSSSGWLAQQDVSNRSGTQSARLLQPRSTSRPPTCQWMKSEGNFVLSGHVTTIPNDLDWKFECGRLLLVEHSWGLDWRCLSRRGMPVTTVRRVSSVSR